MAFINTSLYPKHIALACKSSADWIALDPVLLNGEIAIESDTLRIKIGNGSDTFSNLSYTDQNIRTRLEYLEQMAEAMLSTTNSVIRNIQRGESE